MRTLAEIRTLHDQPFPELVYQAATLHRKMWDPTRIQTCTLDSLRTGACSEDCIYCAQSAHHAMDVKPDPLKGREAVQAGARRALGLGSTRYCMATSGRSLEDGPDFDTVLEIIRDVRALGLEACVSLGLIGAAQARRMKAAGCTVYNHNLDTPPDVRAHVACGTGIGGSGLDPVAARPWLNRSRECADRLPQKALARFREPNTMRKCNDAHP